MRNDDWEKVERRVNNANALKDAETERFARAKLVGVPPPECGPEMRVAPARGSVVFGQSQAMYPNGKDGYVSKPAGYMGRATMRCSDMFDEITAQAKRHKKPLPFSEGQVAMGRFYRDLFEKLECIGIKGSSLETLGGGGGSGEYIDAVIRDRQRLHLLQHRIGQGVSMKVRKIRPSKRGSRINITNRALIDGFCLREMSLSGVLKAHGWSVYSGTTKPLLVALCDGLDRMMGPVRGGSRTVLVTGEFTRKIWDMQPGEEIAMRESS